MPQWILSCADCLVSRGPIATLDSVVPARVADSSDKIVVGPSDLDPGKMGLPGSYTVAEVQAYLQASAEPCIAAGHHVTVEVKDDPKSSDQQAAPAQPSDASSSSPSSTAMALRSRRAPVSAWRVMRKNVVDTVGAARIFARLH